MKDIMNIDPPLSSNVSYCIFNDRKQSVLGIESAICYGSVCGNSSWLLYSTSPDKYKKRPVKFLTTSLKHNEVDDKITPMWVEYLTQVSPFRSAYVSECLPHINDTMNLVIDLDKPANLVSNAAIATRFSHERHHTRNGKKGKVWYDLVSKGMDPDLAFMVAIKLNADTNYITGINKTINHSLMDKIHDKFVENFLNNKQHPSDDFSKTKYYYNTYKLFANGDICVRHRFDNLLNEVFDTPFGSEGSDYINPFTQQTNGKKKPIGKFTDQLVNELKGFDAKEFFKEAA